MSKRKSSRSTSPEVTKEKVKVEEKEVVFTQIGYCNLIGASDAIKFVAKLKFKGNDKRTVPEWKELFKKNELY